MFYRIHQGWTSDKVHAEKEMDLKKVGPLRLFALKKLCPQEKPLSLSATHSSPITSRPGHQST